MVSRKQPPRSPLNDLARLSPDATPSRAEPAAWRTRVDLDLAAVAALAPRRRPVQFQRFRSSADPLKAVAPREPGPRLTGGWPLPGPGAGQAVYAVGDIHGRYDLLKDLLTVIATDRAADPAREPLLVFLGDYIDRGPESPLVLEALVWLVERDPTGVCLLKGNHEQGLLEFLDTPEEGGPWLRYGGRETLYAYGVEAPDESDAGWMRRARDALLAAMPASHLRLLQTLDAMAVVGGYVFVHAGVAPGRPLLSQREAELLWIRAGFLEVARPSPKVVVHGHTWRGVEPELLEGRIGVDTGAYETGVLTAVRLDGAERRVLQARDPYASWSVEEGRPRLIRRPQDFRQLDWSVELNFSQTIRVPQSKPMGAPAARVPSEAHS